MCYKSFDRKLYDQYNEHGIQVAVSFLRQLGYEPSNFDECYKSHDFVVVKDGRTYKVECEVSAKWINLQFPYRYMSVPYRKKDSKADFYIRTNPAGSSLLFMPMAKVLASPLISKDTTYTKNEKFFNVDVASLTLYYVEDGVWYSDEE